MRITFVSLIAALAAVVFPAFLESSKHGSDSYLELTVRASGSGNLHIADFSTRLIGNDGRIVDLNVDSANGSIQINKKYLAKTGFVIVCHKYFYCGAIDVEKSQLIKFDSYSIDLAPFHT
jgi:hypothetical protein